MRRNIAPLACSALAFAAAIHAAPAFAQSSGAVDFENDIIVTGAAIGNKGVSGVNVPDTPKAKQVLDQSIIARQVPGQTINDVINLVPGVSFQNNDPFGSSGGKLYIRGFDKTRINETFDGMPLNDTGNYDLYSNQQLDPELIDQVNVNLGTTDVDSPTAAATGSTVNYRSLTPREDFHARVLTSVGDFNFFRIFGMVETGNFTKFGTRAWLSASKATNDAIFGGIGKVDKTQFNGKIYQPIGSNGDYIFLAAHWNRNRNNFFGSVPMFNENYGSRTVGGANTNRYPLNSDEMFYQTARCSIPAGVAGTADAASSCGGDFEYRYNPSDTGNIRINSRFTLADGLIFTFDPSIQYTKANGGGTVTAFEGASSAQSNAITFSNGTRGTLVVPAGQYGFYGAASGTQYFFGRDLNGDGDTLDTVRLLAPSQTQTYRLGLNTSLRWDINPQHTIRVAYSYDRGRHRQTGEVGYLRQDGFGVTPFPVDNGIAAVNGTIVQKRNRLSYAILHQFSGEYRGKFFDNALAFTAGVRMPFLKRNLSNYCFTTSATGTLVCTTGGTADAAFAAANPNIQGPQQRILTYNKPLPTVGATLNLTPNASLFANYSKGMQVPGTDNLYNAFFFAANTAQAKPTPETSDNFDFGARWRSRGLLVSVTGWYTAYHNRLAQAYDRDLNASIYRNLGEVERYGIDGNISYTPDEHLSFYAFGSYLKSKIKDNVDAGSTCAAFQVTNALLGCTAVGQTAFFQTAGKRESGAPTYTFGGRIDGNWGPVAIGVQVKRTGPRFVNDQNLPFYNNNAAGTGIMEIFPAKAPAYTQVDLSAKVDLGFTPLGNQTFLQLNVTNLFNQFYVGGFDGTFLSYQASNSPTFAQLGVPRTFIASLNIGF